MKLTNQLNLPNVFMDLCADDDYDKGEADFSTTELISPPYQRQLQRIHADDVTDDISSRFWSISGNAKHYILEKIAKRNPDRYIAEKRFYIEVDGWKVGGKLDLYDIDTRHLWDYKETSVWKYKKGDFSDWATQASINRYILSQNGIHPAHTSNIAMMRDWKKREAKHSRDYPEAPMIPVRLYTMSDEDTLRYIQQRVRLHALAREGKITQVCSPGERWARGECWAVKKKGRKTAVLLHNSEDEAKMHLARLDSQHSIEHRPPVYPRCEEYCNVAQFCSFGKHLISQKQQETEES